MTASTASAQRITPVAVGNAVGIALIVVGGLVAAVTGPLNWEQGSWLAAYLVLVGGATQCLIARVVASAPWADGRGGVLLFTVWNLGFLLVIVGALARLPLVADLGGLLIVPTLVVALRATLVSSSSDASSGGMGRVARVLSAIVFVVVLIGVPVGLVISHLRAAG
ncbi:hypothetical protein ACWGST_00265 [Agromyces sp. NPDC055520]